MHLFSELVDRSIDFSLRNLDDVEEKTLAELQASGATHLVRNLQMIAMQRVVLAVGVMSIFEAHLQDKISCQDGFLEARKMLKSAKEFSLDERLGQFVAAINVLKHGRGRSYDTLLKQFDILPFRIRQADQDHFSEGNISELATLIEVDKEFVLNCVS
jgi:hypothetical protein